ncbi:hypothetical protein D3C80_1575150 [compost metagenome]
MSAVFSELINRIKIIDHYIIIDFNSAVDVFMFAKDKNAVSIIPEIFNFILFGYAQFGQFTHFLFVRLWSPEYIVGHTVDRICTLQHEVGLGQ